MAPTTVTLFGGGYAGTSTSTVAISTLANVSGGLIFSGSGATTLSGASTYAGATDVQNGALQLTGSLNAATTLNLGNGSNSGKFILGSAAAAVNQTVAGLTTAGSGTSNAVVGGFTTNSTLTVNTTAGTNTFAGALGGAGTNENFLALTKTGAGTLEITSANNTYTGGTTIGASQDAAVLRASATQALGSGAITFDTGGNASTARLELAGGSSLNNAISLTGRTSSSVAIQNVSGSNTVSGTITLGIGGNNYWIQSDAGLLTLSGATAITAASGARTLTLQGAGNGAVSGVIQNGGGTVGIAKNDAGTWTLSGASSYTGDTTINGGTLTASLSNNSLNPVTSALGNPQHAHNITVNNGGTLNFAQGDTFGGADTVVVPTLVINAGGTVTNTAGNFTTLGPVTLNGGTLTTAGGAIAGYQSYSFSGNVTVGGSAASTISVTGGGNAFNGFHLGTNTTFNVADATSTASDLTVSAPLIDRNATLTGAGSLTKTGVGTMTLTGANTFTGTTTVSNGTLEVGGANSLGGTSGITVNTGGTLLLSNTGTTDRINNAATMNLNGGTIAISGNVVEGSSPGIGALTLSASSTIDLTNGDGTLKFDDSHLATWSGTTLSIYNYTAGSDHLFFGIVDHSFNGSDGGLTDPQLAQVSFFSGTNSGFLGTATFLSSGFGEIVPVPEPSSVATVMGILGLIGWRERRRRPQPTR